MIYTYSIALVVIALSIVRAEYEDIKFLIADKRGIWTIGDVIDKPTLILEASNITSFDYHAQKNLLFYNNDETKSVYSRQLFNKSAEPKLIISNSQKWSPASLAVDFINDKLYVLDAYAVNMEIFDLDGKNQGLLMGFSMDNLPLKVLLDSFKGLMFLDSYETVKRFNMDGSSPKYLLANKDRYHYAKEVIVLDRDCDSEQIFWANQTSNAIYSVDYDGNKLHTLLIDDKLNFSSLSFSFCGKQMYLLYKNTFELIALDNGKISNRTQISLTMIEEPILMKPYYIPQLRKIKNPCAESNGGCQQICTLKPADNDGLEKSCGCKPGYNLLPDLKSCEPVSDFIIFPYGDNIKAFSLYSSSISFNQAMHPIAPKGERWFEFGGIGCDALEQQIYFNTNSDECMYRTRMNDSVQENFFCGNKYRLRDLTVDWASKNVYFTSYNLHEEGRLQVINPRNKSKIKTILQNLFRPNKLVVHPNKGYIFFTENYLSPNSTIINRVNTDGTDLKQFKDEEISKVDHLAIDFKNDKLYWVDNGYHEGVKYMDFDGTNIKRLPSKYAGSPNFLDIYKDHVFLTSNFDHLHRLDKVTGEISKDFSEEIKDQGFYGFRVCDKSVQKLVDNNPCLDSNGGCEDFCFTVPKNVSDGNASGELVKLCGCSDGKILQEDGKTCIEKKTL